MYNKLSDQELTALLKEGDHEAFTEVFNRYNSLLYIHAFKKLHEREGAKDVVQEVLSSLWIKRELVNPGNNLGGYLYTAIKHRIFDLLSHQKVTNKHVISLQKYLEHGQVVRADYQIREKQLAAIIEKEIAALPPRMREVFMLSRKENLTHKEIAERLAISEQTVTDQVKKALKILKPKIGLSIALMMSGMI
jgi:RNA polymerase sigma-70 factor (ECF subfamily)